MHIRGSVELSVLNGMRVATTVSTGADFVGPGTVAKLG